MWIGQKWQYNRFNLPLILVGDTPSKTREHLLLVLFVNLTSFYLQKDMLLLPFVSSRLLLALTCFMDSVFLLFSVSRGRSLLRLLGTTFHKNFQIDSS